MIFLSPLWSHFVFYPHKIKAPNLNSLNFITLNAFNFSSIFYLLHLDITWRGQDRRHKNMVSLMAIAYLCGNEALSLYKTLITPVMKFNLDYHLKFFYLRDCIVWFKVNFNWMIMDPHCFQAPLSHIEDALMRPKVRTFRLHHLVVRCVLVYSCQVVYKMNL